MWAEVSDLRQCAGKAAEGGACCVGMFRVGPALRQSLLAAAGALCNEIALDIGGGLHLLFSSCLIQEIGWHMPCNSAQLAAFNCCDRVTHTLVIICRRGQRA
jgi:hypothetical protein